MKLKQTLHFYNLLSCRQKMTQDEFKQQIENINSFTKENNLKIDSNELELISGGGRWRNFAAGLYGGCAIAGGFVAAWVPGWQGFGIGLIGSGINALGDIN